MTDANPSNSGESTSFFDLRRFCPKLSPNANSKDIPAGSTCPISHKTVTECPMDASKTNTNDSGAIQVAAQTSCPVPAKEDKKSGCPMEQKTGESGKYKHPHIYNVSREALFL